MNQQKECSVVGLKKANPFKEPVRDIGDSKTHISSTESSPTRSLSPHLKKNAKVYNRVNSNSP
jgi:hypothetical protein